MSDLPAVFDATNESVSFLAKAKQKAGKKFSFTRRDPLADSRDLAYSLFLYYRDAEAVEVIRHLSQFKFSGNHHLWSPIEGAFSLLARLKKGTPEGAEAIARLREVEYVDERLEGMMLGRKNGIRENINDAVVAKSATSERGWRMIALHELAFILALGASEKFPLADAEKEFQENVDRLRAMLKVPPPK